MDAYKTAALTVLAAVREYLPPDGISKDALISRVIEAVDNPEFNEGLHKPRVRVRPLEWVDLGDGMAFRAFLPVIGGIRIEPYGVCGWWEVLWSIPGQCGKLIPDVFDTADEAKAAAQADYERRILSAIET